MTDLPIDDYRERIVRHLGSAWANDVIDEAEFDRRVMAAFDTRDRLGLERLVADLPANGVVVPLPLERSAVAAMQPAQRRRVMLSSIDERVHDVMPALVEYGVRLGSLELDFREATFGDGVTEILLDVKFGSVELTMPSDVTVEMRVDGLLSSVEYKNRSRLTQPAHRIVRVTGRCVLGSVEVSTRDQRPAY